MPWEVCCEAPNLLTGPQAAASANRHTSHTSDGTACRWWLQVGTAGTGHSSLTPQKRSVCTCIGEPHVGCTRSSDQWLGRCCEQVHGTANTAPPSNKAVQQVAVQPAAPSINQKPLDHQQRARQWPPTPATTETRQPARVQARGTTCTLTPYLGESVRFCCTAKGSCPGSSLYIWCWYRRTRAILASCTGKITAATYYWLGT